MELPNDVVRWVAQHFNKAEIEPALEKLRSAEIHTGEPASSRLLRCLAFNSRGNLRLLDQSIKQLGVDFRDVIVAAEYTSEAGKSVRQRDFNNPMETPSAIPDTIRGKKYISLTTFRKNGAGVATPVWFGEEDGKLYVMTISAMGKTKRIRNNPQVLVAPCSIRGKITGPEVAARARLLPVEDHTRARKTITRKYFLARITSPWSRADAFIELTFS